MQKTVKKGKKNIIGLRELREDMEKYIARVNKGESFTIVRRSKPVFRIAPIDGDNEKNWETVIDFTEINPRGVSGKKILEAIKRIDG